MSLQQRLKLLRSRSGWTQEEVATRLKQLGVNATRVQIARWENGLQEPTLTPVQGLAKL